MQNSKKKSWKKICDLVSFIETDENAWHLSTNVSSFKNGKILKVVPDIYLYTYKTLITLIVCLFVRLFVCLFVCLFETVRTNPGYGMATLIYNNLLNLISGTVILLRSS